VIQFDSIMETYSTHSYSRKTAKWSPITEKNRAVMNKKWARDSTEPKTNFETFKLTFVENRGTSPTLWFGYIGWKAVKWIINNYEQYSSRFHLEITMKDPLAWEYVDSLTEGEDYQDVDHTLEYCDRMGVTMWFDENREGTVLGRAVCYDCGLEQKLSITPFIKPFNIEYDNESESFYAETNVEFFCDRCLHDMKTYYLNNFVRMNDTVIFRESRNPTSPDIID
jgi:hypothetical protein